MTCIVSVIDDGDVYMGGDSAGAAGWSIMTRADAKVFRNGEFLMGFTDSFRMGQILRYAFAPPHLCPDADLHRYMVVDFVNAVRESLKQGGWARKDSEQEAGGTFLVGVRGRLFCVCSDYQVGENAHGFDAVGCGHDLAKGVLYASGGQPPRERIRVALEAAEQFSNGVRGPFVILGPQERGIVPTGKNKPRRPRSRTGARQP
jgi:ATP-dependent protease HslVU (ClpYQ) peptidase subunit